jgi:hypothetical protein
MIVSFKIENENIFHRNHINNLFCSTLSEFENFLLCERILINVNLSKRNVKLILKILSDLEPLRGSSNKKTLHSTRSCVNCAFFGMSGPD